MTAVDEDESAASPPLCIGTVIAITGIVTVEELALAVGFGVVLAVEIVSVGGEEVPGAAVEGGEGPDAMLTSSGTAVPLTRMYGVVFAADADAAAGLDTRNVAGSTVVVNVSLAVVRKVVKMLVTGTRELHGTVAMMVLCSVRVSVVVISSLLAGMTVWETCLEAAAAVTVIKSVTVSV